MKKTTPGRTTFALLCAHLVFFFAADAWSPAASTNPLIPSLQHSRRSISSAALLANIGRCYSTAFFLAQENNGDSTATATVTAVATTNEKECTTLTRKPKTGDIVTFTLLRFQPPNDSDSVVEPLFDTMGTLQLRLNHGNYLPGLHQLLSTMSPGETVKGSTIDAGYGAYNPQLVFQIDTSQLDIDTSLVKIGSVLALGNGLECRVTQITKDDDGHDKVMWTLDGNHPSAGSSWVVDVRLDAVEEAPSHWEYVGNDDDKVGKSKYSVATFGLGCFWGGELAYQRVPGVVSTSVGYTQGEKVNPSYEEVCTGSTGHTEAVQVVYDPNQVSYRSLLHLAFNRLGDDIYKQNQVGNDRGTQYRHGIYYHNEEQRQVAEELLSSYASADREVFTEIKEAKIFYTAEEYHQQYLLKGGQSAKKGASENIRCYG